MSLPTYVVPAPAASSSAVPRSRARIWLRRLAFLFLLAGLALIFSYLGRAPLLRAAARAWLVNSPTAHADAIVVLGGGLEYRPFAAARLCRDGVAPRILVSQPELPPTVQLGLTTSEAVIAREVLLSNGVPLAAIQMLGTNLTSTRDEAAALKDWVAANHPGSVLIPTEIFHTRRVRWIFSKALRGSGTRLHIIPVEPIRYQSTNWWQHEDGLVAFQNEVLKTAYYWLKY